MAEKRNEIPVSVESEFGADDLISSDAPEESASLDRRSFLTAVGGAALAMTAGSMTSPENAEASMATPSARGSDRKRLLKSTRLAALNFVLDRPFPTQRANGEETDYPYVANYTKLLGHNALGEVRTSSYRKMLAAINSGKFADWEGVPIVGGKVFKNPLAAVTLDLIGYDSQQFALAPAPRIDSAQNSAEAAELYWQALCRDVHFSDYGSSPAVTAAALDLSPMRGYKGPRTNGTVTTDNVFRGNSPGCVVGPYISQFLYRDVPWGTLLLEQKQETGASGVDWQVDYNIWLAAQNGILPGSFQFDGTRRFIRNGRDLAARVQIDRLCEPFAHAALITMFRLIPGYERQFGTGAPRSTGLPYYGSSVQSGFATWDYVHLLSLLNEVVTRALKAAWFQKWCVHRRLRPEEFGGRVHNHLTGAARYRIDDGILNSPALAEVFSRNGTYLLPLSYPEGCPPHPAYPSGHSVVAGACATILKAWFDESYVITDPIVANADGSALISYAGSDAGQITLGGEFDKLAWNTSIGRLWAGIHWRSDSSVGLSLGESVAIGLLQEQRHIYPEKFDLSFRRFNGRRFRIRN